MSCKPRLLRAAVQVHAARTLLVHWISRHRPQLALGGLALSSTVKLGLTAAAPKYGLHRGQAQRRLPEGIKHRSCVDMVCSRAQSHHVSSSRSPYPHLRCRCGISCTLNRQYSGQYHAPGKADSRASDGSAPWSVCISVVWPSIVAGSACKWSVKTSQASIERSKQWHASAMPQQPMMPDRWLCQALLCVSRLACHEIGWQAQCLACQVYHDQ
jgi:hypothetical protein